MADNDEVGINAAKNLCERLFATRQEPIYICAPALATDPAEKKQIIEAIKGFDINDALCQFGENDARARLEAKKLWHDERVDHWPDIERCSPPQAASIPLEAFPKSASDYIAQTAHQLQTHPDRIAGSLLAVVGSLACGRFQLSMRTENSSFKVSPNNYLFQVGKPSSKKSPSISSIVTFLKPFAKNEQAKFLKEKASIDSQIKCLSAEEKKLLSEIGKASDPAKKKHQENRVKEIAIQLAYHEDNPPKIDPLYTMDSTPEALIQCAASATRAILLVFDESDKLLMQLAREGFAEIRPLLNTGFSGLESYQAHRVTVKRRHVDALRLGFLGGIQPDVLRPLLDSKEDGFCARFFMINPDEGKSEFINEPVNPDIEGALNRSLETIYLQEEMVTLTFSGEALVEYKGNWQKLENVKNESCGLPFLEGFMGKHESHMGALIVILHALEKPNIEQISAQTVRNAANIMNSLISHYEKTIFSAASADVHAESIFNAGPRRPKNVRDLKKFGPFRGLGKDFQQKLKSLEEQNLLKQISCTQGGRATQILSYNPALDREELRPSLKIQSSTDTSGTFETFGRGVLGKPEENPHKVAVEWTPSVGRIGDLVAIDTETNSIEGREVPELKLMQACNVERAVFLITPNHAATFLEYHKNSVLIFHNFTFDLNVLNKATGFDFLPQLSAKPSRIADTGLLFKLHALATEGQVPMKWSLKLLSQKLLGKELNKDESLRMGWDSFTPEAGKLLELLSEEQIQYAANDVITTMECFLELRKNIASLGYSEDLTHDIQIHGAWALSQIEKRGLCTDKEALSKSVKSIKRGVAAAGARLKSRGFESGKPGNMKVLEAEIEKVANENDLIPDTTSKSGKPKTSSDSLQNFSPHSELIKTYLEHTALRKQLEFYEKLNAEKVFPSYNSLLRTGRTSCSNPNIQNLPRAGIREMIVSSPGHTFIIADYCAIELVTLAQHCLTRYGHSSMATLINEGKDLHTELAKYVLKKDEVTKEERQKAKALNFGIPGGLGAEKLCDYAEATFDIEMTEPEAIKLKREFLKFFPEVAEHLKSGNGSDEIVSTISGRVAAKSTFCQARNFVFQGLAADGAKRALFNLEQAGFRTVMFVHDEVVIEVPYTGSSDTSLGKKGEQIAEIMISSMREFTPDVEVRVEWFAADRYTKSGKQAFDQAGNVIPSAINSINQTGAKNEK